MEELQVEARLERKKKALVLRQRREAKRQLDGLDKKRKEQEKLAARCREMQREDEASSQMMIWFLAEEARERADKKREEDDRCYREIAAVCRQAKCLGVARSTSGATGIQRLQLLQDRIATKETELKRSEEAKSRLDALQSKRPKVTAEMRRFFASSVRRKMEKAIASRDCEHFLHLLEPRHSETQDLLNLESSNGLTPALSAIFTGNLSVLRRLLELGASVEMESSDGMTPLLAAIMTDDIVAMNMLTEFRVDLNSETRNGVTPLLLAADKGRLRALRFLLDSGADVDRVNQTSTSALMQACVSGHYDAVRILLAYGARKDLRDTNSRSAVDCAGRYKYVSILFLLRGLVDSESLMTQLKADDADTETHGHTSPSMDRTARRDRFCIVDQLLNDRNLERLRLLLSAEDSMVSPNYETANGISPLILFCSLGTCSDVLFCLERKCIPTHQNRDGVTALITACKRGDGGMIELLLKYGCSLLTRDFSGRDGFHYLNSNDHPEVAERMTKIHRNAVSVSPQLGLGTPVMAAKSMKAECGDDPRHEIVLTSVRLASEIGRTPELSSPTDRSEHDSDSDDPILDPRIRRWGTRQSVLKRNRHKRQQFNDERERILAAACRGRRNGLIAPLPGDPNGTSKYPVCNHCKEIRARKRCLNCELVLCDKCHARLHEIAHRRHHEYEEVLPEMHDSQKDRCQDHQEEQHSLGHLVCQSRQCVASVYGILNVDLPHHQHANADPEVDKYEAHVRIKREKEMIQKQINVPVAAAHHAAAANEGEIFARPAEFDLAILYMTQKKFDKARELLSRAQRIVQEAVGARHPSMLKVAVAMAKIERVRGFHVHLHCSLVDMNGVVGGGQL